MSKGKRRSYTKEFKEEAVKLIIEQGYSYAEAGRNLGVNPNQLQARAFGAHKPRAPNDNAENRSTNRRIELIIQPVTG